LPQPEGPSRATSSPEGMSIDPTPVAAPRLLACSRELASALDLDLDEEAIAAPAMVSVLAGNALLPGMVSYAR
jgi:uncharacterized protein YdiU (UPF0061 family)